MAYGVEDEYPTLIHGLSPFWNDSSYEPNANMLKSTTTAMSAILGGCDAITIVPEDENNEGGFKSRVARNVLTILREESYLNLTADATVGSYYLENLIEQISISAWKKFQEGIA
jgi:methylmalonyl-CoA mutase